MNSRERTSPHRLWRLLPAVLPALAPVFLLAQTAPAQSAAPAPERPVMVPATTSDEDKAGETIELSPFVVRDENKGYYGSNTMSATRISSKIEDLGASITVVTKQQMADFAMLDINDVFASQAGTEGSSNYTDFAFNSSAQPNDNLQNSPNTSNRIRGLSSSNYAFGGFETSRRMPLDPLTSDGVEISRGPNSILFGLGNAGGTTNQVPVSANLSRNKVEVQLRGSSYGDLNTDGSFRQTVDVNRVLIKDKLAFRVSQLFQETGYTRKPSGVKDERYNLMVKYRPFKSTTISALYMDFHQYGRRPNSITPRDGITPWVAEGSPTWDPRTNTAYINGSPVDRNGNPVATLGAGIPTINGAAVFASAFQTTGRGTSLIYVDQNGVGLWTAPRGTTTQDALLTTTASNNQAGFNYMGLSPNTIRRTQPLWTSDAAVSSKDIYDWSSINVAAPNNFNTRVKTSMLNLDQIILDTQRQLLAVQLGWYREDSPVFYRDNPNGSSGSTYLVLDPNQTLLDGSPNPYFKRTYLAINEAVIFDEPLLNDIYRGQLAYKIDLTKEKGWLKWLGFHHFTGFGEYKHFVTRRYASQAGILDNHSWLAAGTPRANTAVITGDTLPQDQQSPTGSRVFRYYLVGDASGNDIDYAPYSGDISGTNNYTWGNFANRQSIQEPSRLGQADMINGTGGAANSLKIQKTLGGVMQSHLLSDRLVTTVGFRQDKIYTKAGVGPRLLTDGMTHDYEWDKQWQSTYVTNIGNTRSIGGVLKLTRWLSVFGNDSDSFIPADAAVNLQGESVPNPRGKGRDWGVMLSFLDGKLNLRATKYKIITENDRNGNSTTFATRALKVDIYDGQPSREFALDIRARQWIQNAAGGTLSQAQLNQKVADTMKMDLALVTLLQNAVSSGFTAPAVVATSEAKSTGGELALNYNPTRDWTITANVAETQSFQAAIAPELLQYLSERTAVWETIIDQDTKQPWFTSSYNGGQTAKAYLPAQVTTGLNIAQQTVGKSLPQIRRYRANLSTNFYLRAITGNRFWKQVDVGGAVRWEDKGAIGYYGVQQLPAVITELDKDRPIYDKGHTYLDLRASYRTKMFSKKVGTIFQFNVTNVTEGGRLQPVSAWPDGTPNAYRIVDPRQFIFTVTFNM